MLLRTSFRWSCCNKVLALGQRTQVMGILNVTPDSFSDGGLFVDVDAAVEHGLEMVLQGAAIIDVGGESSRPGAEAISAKAEMGRVVPVIRALCEQQPDLMVSIDTTKASVAHAAIEAGATIVNDISAGAGDEKMFPLIRETGAGLILMHMQGTPRSMQDNPTYTEVVEDISDFLKKRATRAIHEGIAPAQLVFDPGIGFGKTGNHNLELLKKLDQFAALGYPLLVGASRKRFIGQVLGREDPKDRVAGSLGVAAWSIVQGAHLLRVHDVIETCDLCALMDTLLLGENLCI